MRSGQGTSGDKGEAAAAGGTVPKVEIGVNKCVGRHTTFMGIRYNPRFPQRLKPVIVLEDLRRALKPALSKPVAA